jgi:hypothetical protein
MGGLTPQQEILERSGRRCCICYGLYGDLKVKHGQIAHLDHNHQNDNPENLAFLCLEHHDEYDTRTSQSKGWTIKEAKRYRDSLYEAIEELRSSARQSVTTVPEEHAPPVWGRIYDDSRMIFDAVDRNTGQEYCGVSAYSLLYSGSLVFDVTNPNELDMRIARIYVDVIKFMPVDIIGVWEGDKGRGMRIREYGCDIDASIGRYECFQISEGFDYIKLSPGEMETIRVHIAAAQEGIYQLRLGTEFSIGGATREIEADNNIQQIGFFDPVFHAPSFDWSERRIRKTDDL